MSVWRDSAVISVLLFVLAATVAVLPLTARQYRTVGSVTPGAVTQAAVVLAYASGVAAFTLFPLPASRSASCRGGSLAPQWNPWQVVDDLRHATAGLSLSAVLTSTALLQIVLNVVLFLPFGILLRFYTRPFGVSVAAMAGVSVLIEVTQATGVLRVYPCAYRLGDTADVILNTAGGAVGWLAGWAVLNSHRRLRFVAPAPAVSGPAPVRSGPRSTTPRPLRAVFSGAADVLIVILTAEAIAIVALAAGYAVEGTSFTHSARVIADLGPTAADLAAVTLLLAVPLIRADRATLGQACVLVFPAHRTHPASRSRVAARQTIRWAPAAIAITLGWGWAAATWLLLDTAAAAISTRHRSITAHLTGTELNIAHPTAP